jgi:hypothetical protein
MPTSKQRHAIALAEHYTRATSPGAARLDQLEAVSALLGDDTPPEWGAALDSARDVAARRAHPDPAEEDPS